MQLFCKRVVERSGESEVVRFSAAIALALGSIPVLGSATPAPIVGYWLTEFDRGVVHIAPCGLAMCGTLIGPGPGTPKSAPPAFDVHNNNPALRTRPLNGLLILADAKPVGDLWRGSIYSPDDGRAFSASFNLESTGTLRVKGCWGFICRTQHWKPAK